MDALKSINTRRTPQSEAARPDQVVNNAGGHVFAVSDETRLRRFLVLGTQGGTYYTSEKKLTRENATELIRIVKSDPAMVLRVIMELDMGHRAPKHNILLFALAAVAGLAKDPTIRRQALVDLPHLARTGSHLFTFVGYAEQFRGWGRSLRTAVADWYTSGSVDHTALQLVKYRQREGWSHRDLLRLSHPKTSEPARKALFAWATGKNPAQVPQIVADFHAAQAWTGDTLVELIRNSQLTHEMLPDEAKKDPNVWKALIDRRMPMTALIRQLPTLTRLGVFDDPRYVALVVGQITEADALYRSRIHPVQLLIAQSTYAAGRSLNPKVQPVRTWNPKRQIIDALDNAFYASFGNVPMSGKRILLALDVSQSMTHTIADTGLSAREASAAMALVTMATEPNVEVVGFTALNGGLSFNNGDKRFAGWSRGNVPGAVSELSISPRQRLDDVVRTISGLPFSGTDCSLPMLYALEKGLQVDTFVVYTDNETWHGKIHPYQALELYRQRTGIAARLVVVGMTATEFSIANPDDAGMLDVAGFDAAVPQLIADFSTKGL